MNAASTPPPSAGAPARGGPPRLTVDGLRFTWRGGFALGPVHIDLGPGLYLLEGGNGAGKTTLMRCLCGALRPQSGEVRVAGEDPVRRPEARARVAWLPAVDDLPDFLRVDEAWQSLAALRRAPEWDGAPLCEALGLPQRLPLAHASAGQRRKAGLVAALAGDPPVLLLDEPFANLDAASVGVVSGWLQELSRARVVLVTAHEPPPLAWRSRARLDPGQALHWSA